MSIGCTKLFLGFRFSSKSSIERTISFIVIASRKSLCSLKFNVDFWYRYEVKFATFYLLSASRDTAQASKCRRSALRPLESSRPATRESQNEVCRKSYPTWLPSLPLQLACPFRRQVQKKESRIISNRFHRHLQVNEGKSLNTGQSIAYCYVTP